MPFSFDTDKIRWRERVLSSGARLLAGGALMAVLMAGPGRAQEDGTGPEGLPDAVPPVAGAPAAGLGAAPVAGDDPLGADPVGADPLTVAEDAADPSSDDGPAPRAPPDDAPDPADVAPVASVLPPICAAAGVSSEECLAVLAGFSFDAYCRLNDVPSSECLAFIRDYRMPVTCVSANLTLTGCIDFLDRQTRLYREQVKGLIAQCETGDAGLCTAAEARAAGLETDLAGLRAENGTLKAQVEAAQAALDAREVQPADVCRAAAQRLNARATEVLGDAAPALDLDACTGNPIAEVTRFLALLSAPDAVAVEGTDVTPEPVSEPVSEPPAAPTAAATCTALPTDGDLAFFLIEQDALFGGLGPVRQNVLVNSLLKGEPAVEAVEKAWPKPLDDAERARADESARLLCATYPATCPAESGVEVCR